MNSFSQGSPSHSETTEIYTNAVKVPNKLQNVQPISVPNLPQLETTFSALPNNVGPSDLDGEDTEDDDMEWEEIDIMQNAAPGLLQTQNVEIVLERAQETIKKRRNPADQLERKLRLESHKMHTIALLASFAQRNRWINDPLLHARLLSLTPLPLQVSFSMIHKKMQSDASRRARLFEAALFKLTQWWHSNFRVIPHKGVRNQTFLEVERQRGLEDKQKVLDRKGKGKASAAKEEPDKLYPWSDRLRSANSLMKHALLWEGSADTSSLLFTALCRALDIPARLVVSLQSVPWTKKSEKVLERSDSSDTDNGAPTPIQRKSTAKAVQVRRSRPKDTKLRVILPRSSSVEPPLEGWPPTVWTELFSRAEGRWIPVDPIRRLIDKKKMFEPPPNCRVNRMIYVVAYEEDGYARDVTLRYAQQFGAKTAKARASTKRGQSNWWAKVIGNFTRPYRLNRDDIEDGEFQSLQYVEGMPTSIGGFKDHPIYALERHLRRDEVIHPLQEVGKFRGKPVYPRSNVQRLRTAETWMREGRVIQLGQQPLKRVTQRAHTINKKRVMELVKANGANEMPTQGLWAEWQTELYVADPVVDGKIPRNEFGNVNLFVPSMLPYGAVHLPFQSIDKVAKELGVDFAPAITGFEFRRGQANPIKEGIVIAAENEALVLSAYWESAQAAVEAEKLKRRERAIKQWTRLIEGLKIRKRLQKDYGGGEEESKPVETIGMMDASSQPAAGGFLTEYDGVIEPFHLPKSRLTKTIEAIERIAAMEQPDEFNAPNLPEGSEEETEMPSTANGEIDVNQNPKTLRERAAEAYALQENAAQHKQHVIMPVASSKMPRTTRQRGKQRAKGSPSTDSEVESDDTPLPASKRPRRSIKAPQPAKRQLRPRRTGS